MLKTRRFLLALAAAMLLMLCFRAVVFTICTVEGDGLEPLLIKGDRVLVNRWSYGLRVGGKNGVFGYTRLGRSAVERGDIVAFDHPAGGGEMLICRCKALPGDTVQMNGEPLVVPGRVNCADADYYWMEAIGSNNTTDSRTLGLIAEHLIIGRVTTIVYSHDPNQPLWSGWRQRFLTTIP